MDARLFTAAPGHILLGDVVVLQVPPLRSVNGHLLPTQTGRLHNPPLHVQVRVEPLGMSRAARVPFLLFTPFQVPPLQELQVRRGTRQVSMKLPNLCQDESKPPSSVGRA